MKLVRLLRVEPSLVLPALTTQDAATSYTEDAGVTLRLRSASANTAATYRVADPERLKVGVISVTPEIALSIAPNYIGEGDSFNLVATATPPAVLPITVNVTLSSTDSDIFLASGSRGAQTITIEAGQTTGETSITSQADGTADNSGTITAQLETGNRYTRPATPADPSVVVLDALPVVSISAPAKVSENLTNGMFDVTLDTGSFTPLADRPISITGLTIEETGSTTGYLGSVDLTAVEIDDSGTSTTVSVTITPTGDYQGWGEITITLVEWRRL